MNTLVSDLMNYTHYPSKEETTRVAEILITAHTFKKKKCEFIFVIKIYFFCLYCRELMNTLVSDLMNYTHYPSKEETTRVAETLITAHTSFCKFSVIFSHFSQSFVIVVGS